MVPRAKGERNRDEEKVYRDGERGYGEKGYSLCLLLCNRTLVLSRTEQTDISILSHWRGGKKELTTHIQKKTEERRANRA